MTNTQLQRSINQTVEQLGDVSRSAGRRLDNARCATADLVVGAASSVRRVGRAAGEVAEGASAKLQAIAHYLRKNDSNDMTRGVKRAMQRHPAKFAVAALAGMFLIRHFMSDKTDS
jgi:hypothetical protein